MVERQGGTQVALNIDEALASPGDLLQTGKYHEHVLGHP